MSFYLTESMEKKWSPVLDHPNLPKIKTDYKRDVTGVLLDNTQKILLEDAPTTSISTGTVQNWEPILIDLVRRAAPNLVGYDIASVQPLTGPVGQIFAMRAQYANGSTDKTNWTEALFTDIKSGYSGTTPAGSQVTDMFEASGNNLVTETDFKPGQGINTYDNTLASPGYGTNTAGNTNAENWGGTNGPAFGEMTFTIDKTTVTAKSRALKAQYSTELEQDLKQMRQMSVEGELINILSSEIIMEINREVLYTAVGSAKVGMQKKADYKGIFDADTDSDGRWSVEKWKGLMFNIEREANTIARETRRGKGNFIICTSDVASALAMAQILDYTPALQQNLEVDDSGNIYAGMLAGRYKVYIDPFWTGTYDYVVVGYKGTSQYDAGMFYCPYTPLELVRAVSPTTFQPAIGFKTRYGLVANPFTSLTSGTNVYYRKFKVTNII